LKKKIDLYGKSRSKHTKNKKKLFRRALGLLFKKKDVNIYLGLVLSQAAEVYAPPFLAPSTPYLLMHARHRQRYLLKEKKRAKNNIMDLFRLPGWELYKELALSPPPSLHNINLIKYEGITTTKTLFFFGYVLFVFRWIALYIACMYFRV